MGNLMGERLNTRLITLLAAAIVTTSVMVSQSQAREIVFPPDGALIEETWVDVHGFRPKGSGKGTVATVSSGPAQEKEAPEGLFSVKVKLFPGVNTITLGDEVVRIFYAAGEAPIEHLDGAAVAEALRRHGPTSVEYEPQLERVPDLLRKRIQPGDNSRSGRRKA